MILTGETEVLGEKNYVCGISHNDVGWFISWAGIAIRHGLDDLEIESR
jgi:hypothetical protein